MHGGRKTAWRRVAADGTLARLRHALQALALPAETQAGLLPGFVLETDELALNFDHGLRAAGADPGVRLSKVQRGALDAVEGLIDRMCGQKNAHLWTRAALRDSAQWSRVRRAARAALEAFGWQVEVPPSRLYEYIDW
ncbi:MAG TPA: hypothetical protein VEO94_01205 [Candidatus Dormibacteraeota bacterium]|nr:hypothetical protein [Candidatus Dormibacteraeota bacterium]